MTLAPVRLKKEAEASVRAGMPWLYTGDIIESSAHLSIPAGSLVAIENPKGQKLGVGYFNAASPIACRVLTLGNEAINKDFFKSRLEKALAARVKKINVPYYRLVHSEADGFPGLLMDRFGETLVIQVGTAGMEQLKPLWLAAVEEVIAPANILLRNDTSARTLEGLPQEVTVIKGKVEALTEVHENGCIYLADLLKGQKTGWFYDQRDNRRMIADISAGKSLIDVYSHSGGFGLLAAKQGATATLVDSSALALDLARQAAALNKVECETIKGDAFEVMQRLAQEKQSYDIVLADPPAFVKSKKDIVSGMKGYEKVARFAAALTKPGGHIFIASCSHHATRSRFRQAVMDGIKKAGKWGEILKETGAAPDHPRHPKLPQSEYLKGLLLKITG